MTDTERLQEIKQKWGAGKMEIDDINYLISEVERLTIVEQAYQAMKKAK
ncbi:hypothetical protein V1498_06715 [Peribacillus sp. SCS-26]